MLPAFTGALLGATAIRPGRPNVWGTVLAVAVLAVAVAGPDPARRARSSSRTCSTAPCSILAVGLAGCHPSAARAARAPAARVTAMSNAFDLQGRRILITGAARASAPRPPASAPRSAPSVALVDLAGCETAAATIAAGGRRGPQLLRRRRRAGPTIEKHRRRARPRRRAGRQRSDLPVGRGLAGARMGRQLRPGDGRQRARADPCARAPAARHDRAPAMAASCWSARSPAAWAG